MNIYVGNLPLEVTADELRLAFAAFGQVTSVNVMDDKYIGSGQLRTYGFVTMSSKAEGEAAISALAGTKLRGREMNIIESLPLSGHAPCTTGPNRYGRTRRQSVR